MQHWNAAEVEAVKVLRDEGWTVGKIAEALHRTQAAINLKIAKTGLAKRSTAKRTYPEPIVGEEWFELPQFGVSVSSLSRVKSQKTGALLSQHCYAPGRPSVTALSEGRKTTVLVQHLLADALGRPRQHIVATYSEAEDHAILAARTTSEAVRRCGRSRHSVKRRARTLGKRFVERERVHSVEVTGAVPFSDRLWREAFDLVPRWIPYHDRMDLISEMVTLRLEGRAATVEAAFKLAKREMAQQTQPWKTRSLEEPLRGADRLCLGDLIDSERPHF